MHRCNLNLFVMPTWWEEQFGTPAPEKAEDKLAFLEEKFPGLITYRQQKTPAEVPDPNYGYTMHKALGADIAETSIGTWDVVPMSFETLMTMTPPDYETSEPVKDLRTAIRETRAAHGSAANASFSGVFTMAMKLRGQDIFYDFYERPEIVKQWTSVFTETLCRHLMFLKDECGDIPYFVLGSCSNCMISPDIYEEFFREAEARVSSLSTYIKGHPRAMGIHHCGTKVDPYMGTYSKIPELAMIESDWQSDLRLAEKKMPGLTFKPMLDPIALDDMSEDEIERMLMRFLAHDAVEEVQAFGLTQHLAVPKLRRMLEVVVDYNSRHGLPGYTRWFV